MAEQSAGTKMAPLEGEYVEPKMEIVVKDYDAAGTSSTFRALVPNSSRWAEWSLMQQAVMLKKGPWSKAPMHEIMFGIVYAANMGLDIMRGDVFSTGEGRIGISNKAKIKMAQATGNIEGIQVEMKDLPTEKISLDGVKRTTDLECTVTIHVKGWKVPIIRTARLSQWFNKKNPNWQGRPEHMLELNTVAHACEYVPGATLATEDDEAPPLSGLDKTLELVAQSKK